MKNLKELQGVKVLSKTEQKTIKGGVQACDTWGHNCYPGWTCNYNSCYNFDKHIYECGYCVKGNPEA